MKVPAPLGTRGIKKRSSGYDPHGWRQGKRYDELVDGTSQKGKSAQSAVISRREASTRAHNLKKEAPAMEVMTREGL